MIGIKKKITHLDCIQKYLSWVHFVNFHVSVFENWPYFIDHQYTICNNVCWGLLLQERFSLVLLVKLEGLVPVQLAHF